MRPFLTEEEAKLKWCPAVRGLTAVTSSTGAAAVTATNRSGSSMDDNSKQVLGCCIASGCMWWGWAGPLEFGADGHYLARLGRCEAPGGAL